MDYTRNISNDNKVLSQYVVPGADIAMHPSMPVGHRWVCQALQLLAGLMLAMLRLGMAKAILLAAQTDMAKGQLTAI